jgi:ubiquinone/menaquinone biosynthesis C-methylase UbiE
MKISDYDEFEYDYSTYWKNRNYEHFCEVMALKKLFINKTGKWFVDIGGSYGRHLPIYYSKYTNPILLDYSLNTLINNKQRIVDKYPKTVFIAANAYFLPFRESCIDGAMMVRVLHHIDTPQRYFSELIRILKKNGSYIQEIPNKMNLKAIIRNALKFNFSYFTKEPYQQPTKHQFEGSNGVESVFLNYHPNYLKNIFSSNGITIRKKIGTSFFRSELLKKLVPMKILIFGEGICQKLFSFANLSPSIFFDTTIEKAGKNKLNYSKIEDILVCPKCKNNLIFKKEESVCTACKSKFEKVAGIWDFRVQ